MLLQPNDVAAPDGAPSLSAPNAMKVPARPARSLVRDPMAPLLLGAFLFALCTVIGVLYLLTSQIRANEMVRHTLEADQAMARVLTTVLDAEAGQRGYLVTLDPLFLAPYMRARNDLPAELAALRATVSDNPQQVARVEILTRDAEARMAHLARVMEDARVSDERRQAGMRQGERLMGAIRAEVAALRASELRLLEQRQADAAQTSQLLTAGLVLVVLVTALTGALALWRMSSQLRAIAETRDALDASNRQLRAEAESRIAAESQARQLQKMEAVGQLTGGIAHDFNNMLAIVIGSLDLAKRRLAKGDADKAAGCIDNALEGAQRASQLTARMMAFARQQPLEPVALDANRLVVGMAELLRRTLGEAVQVETVLAGDLWCCFADPHQLENALVNLCVNGRDAMPDGGRLTITTGNAELDERYAAQHGDVAAGQYVLLSVTDQGTGMPPEVVERAFDPFFTTKGVGRGTGLGLSQVHGFVQQSGGHVKIESRAGEGTTINIYLPRIEATAAATEPTAPRPIEALPHAREGEIILVVEDDERVRNASVDSLRELGYTVLQAADARQALAILAVERSIDLLFTDVVMPDMNGRQLADAVAEVRPGIPILFTTGYTRDAIVHDGMLDPGVALLAKPFTIVQLAHKIRQMLDRRG